jgi:hypothetical protein
MISCSAATPSVSACFACLSASVALPMRYWSLMCSGLWSLVGDVAAVPGLGLEVALFANHLQGLGETLHPAMRAHLESIAGHGAALISWRTDCLHSSAK